VTLALLVTWSLAQFPPAPPGADAKALPTASATARLHFLTGDVSTAIDWANRGLKKEPKVCKAMAKDLAEYGYLVGKYDELTLDEARQVLELDRRISPDEPGRLSKPVIERFVRGPMMRARAWARQGAAGQAVAFVGDVLKVDPSNVEAKALRAKLLAIADGGVWVDPPDAGP
jgi:hypothetical protein